MQHNSNDLHSCRQECEVELYEDTAAVVVILHCELRLWKKCMCVSVGVNNIATSVIMYEWFILHGSQDLAIGTKKGPRKNLPSLYKDLFFAIYGRHFCATYWLSKLKRKWWSSSILVSVSTDNCGHKWFTTQNGMVSLYCNMVGASSSRIVIRSTAAKIKLPVRKVLLLGTPAFKCCLQMDFKGTHNNGKDLLTDRKDPWAESKDFKGLLFKNQFPRT